MTHVHPPTYSRVRGRVLLPAHPLAHPPTQVLRRLEAAVESQLVPKEDESLVFLTRLLQARVCGCTHMLAHPAHAPLRAPTPTRPAHAPRPPPPSSAAGGGVPGDDAGRQVPLCG